MPQMQAISVLTRQAAVTLFHALGVDTAHRWPVERLEGAINRRLDEYLEGVGAFDEGSEAFAILKVATAALDAGGAVSVVDSQVIDPKPAERAPRPPRPKRPPRDAAYAERRASWAKAPVRRNPNRKGVMNVVIRELERATPESPVTKEFIHGVLCLEFPDRDPAGMRQNLENLLPGRLREHYGIRTARAKTPSGRMGYWVDRSPPPDPPVDRDGVAPPAGE